MLTSHSGCGAGAGGRAAGRATCVRCAGRRPDVVGEELAQALPRACEHGASSRVAAHPDVGGRAEHDVDRGAQPGQRVAAAVLGAGAEDGHRHHEGPAAGGEVGDVVTDVSRVAATTVGLGEQTYDPAGVEDAHRGAQGLPVRDPVVDADLPDPAKEPVQRRCEQLRRGEQVHGTRRARDKEEAVEERGVVRREDHRPGGRDLFGPGHGDLPGASGHRRDVAAGGRLRSARKGGARQGGGHATVRSRTRRTTASMTSARPRCVASTTTASSAWVVGEAAAPASARRGGPARSHERADSPAEVCVRARGRVLGRPSGGPDRGVGDEPDLEVGVGQHDRPMSRPSTTIPRPPRPRATAWRWRSTSTARAPRLLPARHGGRGHRLLADRDATRRCRRRSIADSSGSVDHPAVRRARVGHGVGVGTSTPSRSTAHRDGPVHRAGVEVAQPQCAGDAPARRSTCPSPEGPSTATTAGGGGRHDAPARRGRPCPGTVRRCRGGPRRARGRC